MSLSLKFQTALTWKVGEASHRQGCTFFYLTPPPHVGGTKLLKEDEKGGECIFFSQLEKSIHIFSPIDLKYIQNCHTKKARKI